ncbi:hypothetical protein BJX76DRAFT_350228 [Aspergillus varians]
MRQWPARPRQCTWSDNESLQFNQYLDFSPHSIFSDADFLLNSNSSSSSSSTPVLFPDLSAAFPPVDPLPPQRFYDPLLIPPSMFPGDPVSSSSFDQFSSLTTTPGYPTSIPTATDGIDWTALGCLPGSSDGLSEHPANSLESQSQGFTSSVDSPGTPPLNLTFPGTEKLINPPDPPFDHHNQPTITTTIPSPSHTTTTTTHSNLPNSMPSATSLLKSSPASRESSSPKDNPSRISKRQLNTMAARRYRQRRLDQMAQLEEELAAVKRERDELKMRVSKLEGETEALRSMVKERN